MKCPYCSTVETKVIDSRMNQSSDITRRRRECPRCFGRFTTYERVEEVMPMVIKKDGRRENYAREKMMDGIVKSCQKLPITTLKIEEAVATIEKQIQALGLKEIPSRAIGKMVMGQLHKLDKVAYVRFSSVYRDFKDVEEFVAELQEDIPSVHEDNESLFFPFASPLPPEPTPNTKKPSMNQ